MVTAVICAFSYHETENMMTLECTLMDIYTVYRWCSLNKYDIHVLTDITTDERLTASAKMLIEEGVTDSSIMDCVEYLRDRSIHISSITDFNNAVITIPYSEHLFFYFSGHGSESSPGLIIPGSSDKTLTTLQSIITDLCSQAVVILDCCYPCTMDLPYRLVGARFQRVLGSKDFSSECPITLITSCNTLQKSASTLDGSIFTSMFFGLVGALYNNVYHSDIYYTMDYSIGRGIKNWSVLLSSLNLKSQQTPLCYSSHNVIPIMPYWLGPSTNKAIEYTNGVLTIVGK